MRAKIKDLLNRSYLKCKICTEERNEIIDNILDAEIDIPNDNFINEVVSKISLLANPIRLKILYLLRERELPVCIISGVLDVDQTLVSHHLALLRKHGVVASKSIGKFRFYYLKDKSIRDFLDSIFTR
jgi:DNA-binding transcriptional ArsR family regulator